MAEKLRDSGLDCDAILVQGPYVEKIVSESKRLDADLIVIGAHSKGLVSRVLLGSVSEGVLRKSHIPVMVVPAR
jgi:nucleotide-binding universal stress UspA family protein